MNTKYKLIIFGRLFEMSITSLGALFYLLPRFQDELFGLY